MTLNATFVRKSTKLSQSQKSIVSKVK